LMAIYEMQNELSNEEKKLFCLRRQNLWFYMQFAALFWMVTTSTTIFIMAQNTKGII
jgi:hypothetical protein